MSEPLTYWCECGIYCKRRTQVSRSTFLRHKKKLEESSNGTGNRSSGLRKKRRVDENGPAAHNRTPEQYEPEPQHMHEPPPRPPELEREPERENTPPQRTPTPPPHNGENETVPHSEVETIQIAQEFIALLKDACLAESGLSPDALDALHNPDEHSLELDPNEDRELLMCLRMFIAQCDTASSDASYTANVNAVKLAYPEDKEKILSHDQIKRRVSNLTGIHPIINDMCSNSCIGYTGPFEKRETCPCCGESRYDEHGNPRKKFYTIPIAPQIQALKRGIESAKDMEYFHTRTAELLAEYLDTGSISEIDDICCGTDILDAIRDGLIEENDTILLFSFDGCQLYRMKLSDCWIYIWVIVSISPCLRYKKKYVLPGGVFPGPNPPKISESFLYPGLLHIEAVNKEGGVLVWDAHQNKRYHTRLFIILAAADGPGMVHLNGLTGHKGRIGCRLWCGLIGRHKFGSGAYYPVLAKPDNFTVNGCDHPDVPYNQKRDPDPARYTEYLAYLCKSKNTNYEDRRLATGIVKPSIFSGLSPQTILGIPQMFPSDIMHLILNLAALLMKLWRGTIKCADTDHIRNWPWAVLRDEMWTKHGEDVARATPYLPGSFDRPPRNPAEKINSGYKAWEWLLYLFGLGPALLYGVLPFDVWQSYCKMVGGVRLIYMKKISAEQLRITYRLLIDITREFEEIYVQRRADRIHFVRQPIHILSHLAPETIRVGSLCTSSQWTMENAIGNLTKEIGSHSDPYTNLSERCTRRSQINALKALSPQLLDPDYRKDDHIPRGGIDLGDKYILLRPLAEHMQDLEDCENRAMAQYLDDEDEDVREVEVRQWGRLRLPNGQIARSWWKEKGKTQGLRMARNVKIQARQGDKPTFGEVQYYFRWGEEETLAMVSRYSDPDETLLRDSFGTVVSCKYQGVDDLIVIPVKYIQSVVAMVPHSELSAAKLPSWKERVFVVEKPGLDVADLGGFFENDEEV